MKKNNKIKLVNQYKSDDESVYNTWYTNNEERMKAFRTIRRCVINVIASIKNNTYINSPAYTSYNYS